MTSMTLRDINDLTVDAFVAAFGDIAEHSPWVAETAAHLRPFGSREAMIDSFAASVAGAGTSQQRTLLNAHPDLAGKAALAGDLTQDSTREQAGAGLGSLTPDEFARFTRLNEAYKAKFGIPFIFAVKGATKQMILEAFEARIGSDPDTEFKTALAQVARIFRFRIEDRVTA